MKRYRITAQITSGIDSSVVWKGTVENIVAPSLEEAEKAVEEAISDRVVEYDERIQPCISIVETSEITEDPEELSKDLVKAAETHAEDTGEPEMALGDLEAVIEVCIGLIPEAKRSALIEALAKQELLGGPKVLASEL